MRHLTALLVATVLVGCGTLPDVAEPPQSPGADAEYPAFVPFGQVVLNQAEKDAEAQETEDALTARISGLRARAAGLRSADIP